MSSYSETVPWKRLEDLIAAGDTAELQHEIEMMGLRDSARAISRLGSDDQRQVLTLLGPEAAAALVEEISDVQAAQLLDQLSAEHIAPILEELQSDQTADVLANLPDHKAEAVLNIMEPEAAQHARSLSAYDADVAGGLMLKEYLAYAETLTVRDVIDDMRANAEKYREYSIQYTFVISPDGQLVGVLPLRDLLLTPGRTPIQQVMIRNPLFVHDDTHLDELAEFFDDHGFLGVPVCTPERRLVGIVRRSDVQEALGDRATGDYLKTQGIVNGDELRSLPLLVRSRRRLSWLSVNILLNVVAASVIAMYTDTLDAVIALAVFLPIISDMSGCSGNQAVAVSMRELSLGLVKPLDAFYVWMKEISVGLINGVVLGLLIGTVALIWKGNLFLGVVVGTALMLNTLVAVSIGGVLPLVLKGFKVDPALASGPILTTITDMCGFFLTLSFATLMLSQLT
ncbi:MAG: magnesium transporter [Candidatus Hydrogenedentes bacterium]|nr:magnesium transporter [Candidatus Hydrogenedentota bacterium]